jgi:hypothetical protein
VVVTVLVLAVQAALAATAATIVGDVTPAFDEGWRDKLARTRRASANARQALSDHNRVLGDAARRGQHRNSPDDDDAVD